MYLNASTPDDLLSQTKAGGEEEEELPSSPALTYYSSATHAHPTQPLFRFFFALFLSLEFPQRKRAEIVRQFQAVTEVLPHHSRVLDTCGPI